MGPKGQSALIDEAIIKEIASQHGKTAVQIVLAWGLARGCTVIPKAASKEHQIENWEAGQIQLSKEEIEKISSLNKNENLFTSTPDVKFNMLS